MYSLFMNWIDLSTLNVSDDLIFIFVSVASIFILSFLLDFFRFLFYYITERRK